MVQINWTNQAVSDLKNIFEFIASDSEYYAKREVSRLKLRTEHIKLFLRIGRVVSEIEDPNIREIIEGRYRIVYKIIQENEVDILTVHHSARLDLNLES